MFPRGPISCKLPLLPHGYSWSLKYANHPSALAEIRSDQLKDLPGMYVGLAGEQFYALATCKVIEKGTRMYIVNVNTDGMDRLNKNELVDSVVGGRVEECQYAYLTSGREGLELGGNRA